MYENIYWILAIAGTVVFAIQFLMSVVGIHAGGGDTDFDLTGASDVDPAGATASDLGELNFFSIKSITAFVTFFGWGGVFWGNQGWTGLLLAVASGAVMAVITTLIIFFLLKLQQSGNLTTNSFLNQTGTVYLTIPASRSGAGKVTVKLPTCTRQIRAFADEELSTGTQVVIVEALSSDTFLVKKQ